MLIKCKFYVNKNTVFSNTPMLNFHFIAKLNIENLSNTNKMELKKEIFYIKNLETKTLKF